MKKHLPPLLLSLACVYSSPSDALTMSEFDSMSAAAGKGDTTARRLLDAYLSGSIQALMVAHAMQPIKGLCTPDGFVLRPADVGLMVSLVRSSHSYRGLDPEKMPISRVILDALIIRYACKTES